MSEVSSLYHHSIANDDKGSIFNPNPVPYQGNFFKSATMLKQVPLTRRHQTSFNKNDQSKGRSISEPSSGVSQKRGIILHTDRYYWDEKQIAEKNSQRERIEAEREHIEKIRESRKQSSLNHRVERGLLMGGTRVELEERASVTEELSHLKALLLPQRAKDLLVGRGTNLPSNHQLHKPKKLMPLKPDRFPELGRGHFFPRKYDPIDPIVTQSAPMLRDDPSQSYSRECTCSRLPSLPKEATFARRGKKRKSFDEPNLKGPVLARSTTNFSKIGIPKPNPTLKVNNLVFHSPLNTEREDLEEKTPDWAKQDDDDDDAAPRPESEMEIDVPPPVNDDHTSPTPRIASPIKAVTPNPLKAATKVINVSNEERDKLRDTFVRLDTDADGHLLYPQVRTQLTEDVKPGEERYLKVVYDITSTSTFFGLDEFVVLSKLTERIKELEGPTKEAFSLVDMITISDTIIQLTELYETLDKENSGELSMESVEELLSSGLSITPEAYPNTYQNIIQVINPNEADNLSKIDFLAYIPYFVSLTGIEMEEK